jgi:regulator of cell morphogenesis and NO signaling
MMAGTPDDANALIDHILSRYHEVHRKEMPELIRLAKLVEAEHARHPRVPRGLSELLLRMSWEMEAHMQKEEQGLFPTLRAGEGGMAMACELMRDEHDDHAARLAELAALTHGHELPADASPTWRALYAGTAKFAADLREHIHLENDVLFPRAGA